MRESTIHKVITFICLISCVFIFWKPVHGADVNLYAEGIYLENEVWVSVYADFTPCVISFGFTLHYDPLELLVIEATKNEDLWYFGDGTVTYPYKDPDISIIGQVTFVGGKLDINDPLAGVCGNRVFLGKIKFQKIIQVIPTIVLEPTQILGFESFVTTAGLPLGNGGDSVIFGSVSLYNESRDDDQDGFTNIEEYNAQTDPGDRNSYPVTPPAIPALNMYGLFIFFIIICIWSIHMVRKKIQL